MVTKLRLQSCLLIALAGALGSAAGCGGGGSSGGSGGSGTGASGGTGGSGPGLPGRLPEDDADCASATGSDGCFFDACCAELVACSENPDCATTYACYLSCPSDDSDCFLNCAGSAFEGGLEGFTTALACAAPAGVQCGGVQPGAGGSGGSGGSGAGGEGGGAGTTPTDVGPLGTASDAFGWDLVVPDDPITAELTLDDERTVSEEVTIDGGTVTATAEDGTVFELTIPEGALYGPTVITLTPLLSFSAAPLEGEAYGVQIEPDGLPLMGSPTLAITPPDGVEWPVDQEIPLAVNGADNTVSLSLVDPESDPLHLVLTHFSSYAVLFSEKGRDAELSQNEVRRRFGGDVEERMQSATAERLGKQRQGNLLGTSAGTLDELGFEKLAAEYREHVIKPRIAMAGESCAAGKLAIRTVLGADRQTDLLGYGSGMGSGTLAESDFIALLPTVSDVCMREEYEICRDEHVLTRVLPAFFGLLRQATLLGLVTESGGISIPPPWVMEAEEYAKRCLQFEVQFDSSVRYTSEDPDTTMNESVTARVPIGLMATLGTLPPEAIPPGAVPIGALIMGEGPAPLESSGYSFTTNQTCRTVDAENPADGNFYVSYLGFIVGDNSPMTPGGAYTIKDVGLSIAIEQNLSSYNYTDREEETIGCGAVTGSGSHILSWSTTLGAYLLGFASTSENGAWLTDWAPVNGDIIATKDLTLTDAAPGLTSTGPVRLVLFHTPQPPP